MTTYTKIDSPVGELLLVGEGTTLTSLSLPGQRNAPVVGADWRRDDGAFGEAARQLSAYFTGRLPRFDLSLAPAGTGFQQRVWRALDEIPYGTTTTYGELAARLGVPRSEIRAVGAAIGANPLLIVRPCHRVVGADGSMRGYAGGVEKKVRLLTLEGALQPMLG
ncbi:methylated-DNA--[protein]-cysteine S-methyltransferase [Streptomyces sp. NPDC049541]|uniref:methylated-DNA--[protein]-cysteine S-methyltransferase n=1 Tax=Streptomyces sp. NPDC049541 TaxID=3365594 RepID=UPI00378DDF9E